MTKRVLWKMLLLEFVTLGIYRLYFLIKTRREMMQRDPNVKIKSPALLIAPIVIILAAVVFLVVSIVVASVHNPNCTSTSTSTNSDNLYSLNTTDTSTVATSSSDCSLNGLAIGSLVIFYVAILVGGVLFVIWEWSYAHGVSTITGEKLSFAVTLAILILVPDGIDILIVQDYFNKLDDGPASPVSTAGMMPPSAPTPPVAPAPPVATPPATPAA